jgi:ankyrin repeat protein
MTPAFLITQAAASGDLATVRALLEQDPVLAHCHSREGWTPLHVAAHFGHTDVAEALLAAGADVQARAENAQANTPLLWAVIGQQVGAVGWLLAHGAQVGEANLAGATALHKAAVLGDAAIVRLLLAHGAEVNARNSGGQTPLTHARYNRHDDVAALLRDHAGSE